jgi:hypothetical protein
MSQLETGCYTSLFLSQYVTKADLKLSKAVGTMEGCTNRMHVLDTYGVYYYNNAAAHVLT